MGKGASSFARSQWVKSLNTITLSHLCKKRLRCVVPSLKRRTYWENAESKAFGAKRPQLWINVFDSGVVVKCLPITLLLLNLHIDLRLKSGDTFSWHAERFRLSANRSRVKVNLNGMTTGWTCCPNAMWLHSTQIPRNEKQTVSLMSERKNLEF